MRSPLFPLAAAAALAAGALAQQYAGDVINNTLYTLNGAAINYFKIQDTTSKAGGYGTLLNYYSAPNGNRLIESQVQRVVIVVHGLDEDPWTYWQSAAVGLQNAKALNPAINESTVAIIAPYFANGDGKGTAYPWTAGLAPNKGSTSSALVWSGSQWASGAANQYPWNHATISSYTVLDQIILYYNNATLYPNLKHIVIAGHSLGGQTVHRYAAVGNQLNTRIPMTYWSGNPDSYAWLNSSRPIWPATCTMYDNWRYGISNYTNTYAAGLVAAGSAAVEANFRTRRFVFARGLDDWGLDSSTCAPTSQGANRGARFFNFLNYFPPRSPQLVDYFPGVGHDAPTIFASRAGIQRFFLDNWDGSGTFAPDAGPRMMAGDNPSPDPNYQALWGSYPGPWATIDTPQPTPSSVASVTPPGAAAKTYTYAGCYSDSGARAITNNIWSGNLNATVESCVGACAARGYSVAGLESGTDCWCDKQIQNSAALQPEASCFTQCTGNGGEFCGGAWMLSVYNTGPLTVYTGPHAVPSVGPYNSIGCWTDQGGARTLSAKVPALGAGSTIEACAAACTGYSYFGTEYGQECYCDNVMNVAGKQAALSSCAMPCAGNASETCGAGNFLNVYQYNGTTPIALPTTTVSSTVSASSTTTTTSASGTPPAVSGLAYQGCYLDSADTRTLGFFVGANGNTMTPTLCSSLCAASGYAYAGIEYGDECYCGNTLPAASLEPDSDCSMPCAGDSTLMCGASWRLSVFSPATGGSSVSVGSTSTTASTTSTSSVSVSTSTTSSITTLSTTTTTSAPTSTPSPIAGLTYQGCYLDSADSRTLSYFLGANGNTMTPTLCSSLCTSAGYTFAGIEYGDECYCGNMLASTMIMPNSDCSMPCAGDATINCGASWRLSVYSPAASSGSTTTSATTSSGSSSISTSSTTTTTVSSTTTTSTSASATPSTIAGLAYQGCYLDAASRTLGYFAGATSNMAPNVCTSLCTAAGYTYAGIEYADECYCGNSLSTLEPDTDCSMACAGDAAVMCGASWRLSVYSMNGTAMTSTSGTSSSTTTTSVSSTPTASTTLISTSTVSSSKTSSPSAIPTSSNTAGLSYQGCYVDSADSRTLGFFLGANGNTMTPDLCSSLCTAASYTYAGIEYGDECYCGNSLTADMLAADTDCSMPCAGDASIFCGASWRLSVYAANATSAGSTTASSSASTSSVSSTVTASTTTSVSSTTTPSSSTSKAPTPTPSTTSGLTYQGCYLDAASRTLGYFAGATSNMAPSVCSNLCTAAGFTYAGIEYADECYCGSVLSILMPDSDCSMACAGDAAVMCGASWRLSVYTVGSASSSVAPSSSASSSSSAPSSSSASSSSSAPTSTHTSSSSSIATTTSSSTSTIIKTTSSASSSSATSSIVSTSSGPVPTGGAGMAYAGCYSDSVARTLPYFSGSSSTMTGPTCAITCASLGYSIAGIEYGDECYCGHTLENLPTKNTDATCSMMCAGDATQPCGGPWLLTVYSSGAVQVAAPPVVVKSVGNWTSIGCWTDSVDSRALAAAIPPLGVNNTVEACAAACTGHNFFGVEYGDECYCGDAVGKTSLLADAADCSMTCAGNATEFCGAGNRLNVYQNMQVKTRLRRGVSFW